LQNQHNHHAQRPPTKTNTTICSICRHHPCPHPAFTPYPTHSPTPPASSASIPLAQLLAPRRRQRPHPLPAHRPGYTRLQTEPPCGHYYYINYNHLPDGCKRNSAPSCPFSHSLTFRLPAPPLCPADSPPAAAIGSSPLPPAELIHHHRVSQRRPHLRQQPHFIGPQLPCATAPT
jgi:hypothetical protein